MKSHFDYSSSLWGNHHFTASALLAKLYLYQKNWAAAEENATEIIDPGLYSIETDLNNVFLTGSNETIWKLSSIIPGLETWKGKIIFLFQ